MNRVLLGITAVIGLFVITESLTCNKCSVGLIGICLFPSTITCSTNTSVCVTSIASFPSVSTFRGLDTQGCIESAECTGTVNGTILGVDYTVTQSCCNQDNCNFLNSASYVQLSLSAVLSAALLACVWGQSVY